MIPIKRGRDTKDARDARRENESRGEYLAYFQGSEHGHA